MKKTKNKKAEGEKRESGNQITAETTALPGAPRPTRTDLPAPGEYKIVPRGSVRPDPNQPRKTFNPETLKELAESIRKNGILSPLVVQFVPAELKIIEPDFANEHKWQAVSIAKGSVEFESREEGPVRAFSAGCTVDGYQIVFGERRWRASEIAGLREIPVIVRELTEREVFAQQFIENNQRENLSALEEAKAIKDRLATERVSNPDFKQSDLAELLNLSDGTVSGRLALLRLSAPVTEALTGGKIQMAVAGLIAMVPNPNAQEKLLAQITNEEAYDFPFSSRDVEQIIEDEYFKSLKEAPFDLKDPSMFDGAQLVKGNWVWNEVKLGSEIVVSSCEHCPFRTGNMKSDFPQIKNFEACTKPGCYQAKCVRHFAGEAATALAKGQKVLTPKEFKAVRGQYVKADDYTREHGVYGHWGEMMGKKAPTPALVVTESGLEKVYPKEEAIEAAKKNGTKFKKQQTPEDEAKEEQKRKDAEARGRSLIVVMEACAAELLKGLAKMPDGKAWELAAEMGEASGYTRRDMLELLYEKAKTDKVRVLAIGFCNASLFPVSVNEGKWITDVADYWERAGVDLEAAEKRMAKDAVPALPLEKAEAKQKELLAVKKSKGPKKMSASAKARIAAAARARWAKVKAKAGV